MSRRPRPAPADPSPTYPDRPESAPLRPLCRLDDLAERLRISRRTLERERSAGRFPRPDLTIGKMPLWRAETIARWIDEGGGHV